MDDIEQLLEELPVLLDRVHSGYKNFFSGAMKTPPAKLRVQMEKKIERLRSLAMKGGDSIQKMKVQNLISRYSTYQEMWEKQLRKRETARK